MPKHLTDDSIKLQLTDNILSINNMDDDSIISQVSLPIVTNDSSGAELDQADKLKIARLLNIGDTGKAFDGSKDVTWTLDEIGAQPSKRAINFTSDHTGNWNTSTQMTGKTYVGGWHGTLASDDTNAKGYISLGLNGASYSMDLFIDGDMYVNETQKVYHPGNKPTPVDIGAATSEHTHNNIVSRGHVVCESGVTARPAVDGLSMTQAYNNGYPTDYGNIINLRGMGDGQILVGWSHIDGAHAPIYVRSKRDNIATANWSDWAQIYTTANKPLPSDIGAAISEHTHDYIEYRDTRDVNTTPDDTPIGLSVHLKNNGADGLNDGEMFHSSLFMKGWADHSGGPYGNIAISANNNLWYRASSSGTAWNSWQKVSVDGHTHPSPAIGAWWGDRLVKVGWDGVSEVGKYIDFHLSHSGTTDHDGRLTLTGANALEFNGTFAAAAMWTKNNTMGLATADGSKFQACFRVANSRGCCDLGHDTLAGQLTIRSGQGTAGSSVSVICAVTNGGNYMQYLSSEAGTIALTKHLSDRTKKENIVYINSDDNEFTTKDFYNFIKNDLELATYNLKEEYALTDTHTKLNFIAQDILWDFDNNEENKVGNLIVQAESAMEEQSSLRYDPDNYVSVLAGALKEAIKEIEQLKEEIKELKNK